MSAFYIKCSQNVKKAAIGEFILCTWVKSKCTNSFLNVAIYFLSAKSPTFRTQISEFKLGVHGSPISVKYH